MYFNWFFSTKAYFKVCIKAQNNSVAIFFHINPYYIIKVLLYLMINNPAFSIISGHGLRIDSEHVMYRNQPNKTKLLLLQLSLSL